MQKGMLEIPLAELIIYNNFALRFRIGERTAFIKKTIWQITNQL
jgi:hypothetical protein